jgi:glycosyltransferase involved in cell wall biosynthesis
MRGFSIVIAAHNEAGVIERTLRSVFSNRRGLDRALEVIVVANGCSDDTAERARGGDRAVEVIETPIANKIHALNLGNRAAKHFPRAFLDADCVMSENTLRRVAETFEGDPEVRLVVPGVRHVYGGWNPLLAGYYRLWRSLPYVRKDMMGRGFYAIDEALHERFVAFPALTADDKFIRSLTKVEERRVAEGCYTTVNMPGTFRDLLRCKTRWTYGNMELAERCPELLAKDIEPHAGTLSFLVRRPWHWVNLPTFMAVYGLTRLSARRRLRDSQREWERDESTRVLARATS